MARLNLLEETRFDKLPVTIFENQKLASLSVAKLIEQKKAENAPAALGLALRATSVAVKEPNQVGRSALEPTGTQAKEVCHL